MSAQDFPTKEKKSRHTPGPWVANDFCMQNDADVAVWTSHDPHTAKSICECHFNTAREIELGESGCHQVEAEANARLIAAAPDLLALALQYASECAGCNGAGTWSKVTRVAEAAVRLPCEDCADIRAVIEKVRS